MIPGSRVAVALVLGLVASVLASLAPARLATPTASAATQSGTLSLSAPIVQPGRRPASSAKAMLSGTVRFTPARRGRLVLIQQRVGSGSWKTISKKRQNRAGAVSFHARAHSAAGAYSYRGVAARVRGLSQVASNEQSADVWQQRFRDEFSGTSLSAQWTDRPSTAPSRRCSTVGDPRTRSVGRGTLRMWVKVNPARKRATCRIRSGAAKGRYRYFLNPQISTRHLGDAGAWRYGTFAARIKFPAPQGQHGAFWLQPLRPQYLEGDPANSGAEIDIVEFFGRGYPKGGLASFLYNYGVNAGRTKIGGLAPRATRMLPRRDAWWKQFHVFSVDWTPGGYVFRVDGREHFRTSRGVSGIDEYLILSLLTSDWELKRAQRLGVQPKGTMHVDWTRVWQRG